MKNFILSLCLILFALPCAADLFTAEDDSLSIDMPAGWTRISDLPERGILSVKKGEARLDIKTIDCATESCLDRMINNDIAEVKSRQMTVIKNSYTDEEIKHLELSTAEPFYYISFYSPKNDFSAGYFLINGKGYSVLAKNVTYAEADLLFAAISPLGQINAPLPVEEQDIGQMDIFHAYDTQALPSVSVETLEDNDLSTSTKSSKDLQTSQTLVPDMPASKWSKRLQAIKEKSKNFGKRIFSYTLVSPRMSPFFRELGHGFDVLMLLITLFAIAWIGTGIARIFIPAKSIETVANPQSFYPIELQRLYGTPSIIFRARDNQGNILTALATRWDALIMFTGIVLILAALILMAATSIGEHLHMVASRSAGTIYDISSLALPLGFVILFCGIVWEQISLTEITLFDQKGKKTAVILQKGYSLTQENYQIFFARSNELLLTQRKRFSLCRTWKLMSKDRIEFASITERNPKLALARMCCGHLWGLLRADYDITGAMESRGTLENKHALFNQLVCNLDKPEAVNARDLLAISLLISIRDRDKWYPWFN